MKPHVPFELANSVGPIDHIERGDPRPRDRGRVWRFRVPKLQTGPTGGQVAAGALCREGAGRLPPLSARGCAPARAARGGGGRMRRRAGQVLGNARPAVREPGAPRARGPAALCRSSSVWTWRATSPRWTTSVYLQRVREQLQGGMDERRACARRRSSSTGASRTCPSACGRCSMRWRRFCIRTAAPRVAGDMRGSHGNAHTTGDAVDGAGCVAMGVAPGADAVSDRRRQRREGDDPYLWLEDVHGQKPLEWVQAQNARSTRGTAGRSGLPAGLRGHPAGHGCY